jgi:protein-arginine kinase activator protein McsA
MTEQSEKTTEASEDAADAKEDTQAANEKVDEMPAEAQASSEQAEDKPEAPPEKPADDTKKASVDKEKPLEKMTVKELREMAKDIPGITGVHAMKKDELISGIKEAKGIKDEPVKKADRSIRELKVKIKALKAERQAALEAKDKKKATIFRRRIARLKKKTRKVVA